MTTPLLEVRGLDLSLPSNEQEIPILSDVSLTVAPGDSLGLVGESGSGKSMTAKSIMRLLPEGATTAGSIRLGGHDVLSASAHDLRRMRTHEVAMIFQNPRAQINPVRSIGDYLTEALIRIDRLSRVAATDRARQALDDVGIDDATRVMNAYPHQLSGGMLQRVMIAGALLQEPELLLADEPTTALDVTIQSEVMALLEELCAARDMAMLLITHDLELAAAVCDTIAVMYAGSVVELAPAELVVQHPAHPYTSALLESRPHIDRRRDPLPAIPGQPAAAFEATEGCVFQSRCAHTRAVCRTTRPEPAEIDGAVVHCLRVEQIRNELETIQ